MPVGLEVINDYGKKQIVNKAPLLTYFDKLTGATNTNRLWSTQRYVYALKPDNNSSFIAYKEPFAPPELSYETLEDGSDLWRVLSRGSGSYIYFKYNEPPTLSNQGLEIYDDTGKIQFSSNQKPLKILDIVNIADIRQTVTTINGNRTYWSKDYGSKEIAAVIISAPVWGESPHFMTAAPTKRADLFTFEAAISDTDEDTVSNAVGWKYRLHALVIDVTGY